MKNYKIAKLVVSLSLVLLIPAISCAQKLDFRSGTIKQQNYCDTIPFEYVRNKIIILVKVNGLDKRFIFDTGAVLAISEELQASMNYRKMGSVVVDDINKKSTVSKIVNVIELQIGSLTFEDIPSIITDLKNTYPINCLKCEGIIGSNVFGNSVVSIDLGKKILILTDKPANLDLQNAFSTPLTINKIGKPYLKINIGKGLVFDGLFDSGADKFISISNEQYDKSIKTGAALLLNEGFGITSLGINGIAAAEKKNRVLIKQVNFGDAVISNVITIESGKSKNAIGIQLAEYGNITIDYVDKQFYFVPKEIFQTYKNQKTLGLKEVPEKNFYSIGIVWTNTQAEKIGLKNGYQILKINNQDFTKRTAENDCEFALADFFNSPKINFTYKDDEGKIITVDLVEE